MSAADFRRNDLQIHIDRLGTEWWIRVIHLPSGTVYAAHGFGVDDVVAIERLVSHAYAIHGAVK